MSDQPARIGKYKIISQIGKGGMGAVYKAVHPTLNTTVIIKKLTLTGSQDFIERFRREARLMMDFTNENIVRVYDHFKEGNAYHIVMEYVDGITLEELIESRRFLSEPAALLIFSEVCKALKYAHDHQVIHRDIKPANILISKMGVVKLVDFGVSTTLDADDEDGLTKAGMTIGTPSYLAPEQITNAKNRDKRSDIYSLGVMLYEMVIGKKPFRGGFTPEVINLIEKGKYLPPRKINPKIKPAVQKIIKKAMHHKVNKRFQDLGLVTKKLSRFNKHLKSQPQINEAIRLYLAGKEEQFYPKKGWFRIFSGKWFLLVFSLLIVCGLIGGAVFLGIQKGYHYEWIYPDRYGALQFIVKIRKDHKAVDENYLKAMLYAEEDNSLDLIDDVHFDFSEVKELESSAYYTLMSRKIYLPHHLYKLVLYVENEQYRENFYLYPRTIQKNSQGTVEAEKITFTTDQNQPALPVSAHYQILGLHNNEIITGQTEVSVFDNGDWKEWSAFVNRPDHPGFLSGNRYRLRFKHPDYVTKYYNLTIQAEQTKVEIKIQLIPIPGILFIRSEPEGIKLKINDSKFYLDGSRNSDIKRIPTLTSSPQKFILSPGDYLLMANSGKLIFGPNPGQENVTIHARDELHLFIKEALQDNSLQFYDE